MTGGAPDAVARLHDGQAALDDLQTCVDACGLAGYRLRDAYGAEEGLDLRALDADAAALRAAADRAGQGAELVRAQAGRLADAWRGPGGERASAFLGRHGAAADRLAAAVRAAADCCATLGAELWRILDARVAHTQAVAGSVPPAWLAAARAVLSGRPDPGDAASIVDDQVRPFVHNTVLGEWTVAMRQADDDARAAYRRAMAALGAEGPIRFEIQGDWSPAMPTPAARSAPAPATVLAPSAAPAPTTAPSAMPVASAGPSMPPAAPPAPPVNPLDALTSGPFAPPTLSTPPMSMPGEGGLFGSGGSTGGPPDVPPPPGIPEADHRIPEQPDEPPKVGEPEEPDEPEDPDEPDDPDEPEDPDGPGESDEPGEPPESGEPTEPGAPPESGDPGPPSASSTVPTDPVPAEAPAVAEAPAPATPCEIAADDLPQVGG